MKVKIMQFIPPNGRQLQLQIQIDDKCADKYADILACSARLTIELLMTDEISQTIECSDFDFDITITKPLEPNKAALEEMIMRFNKGECLRQQEELGQS